MRRTAQLQESPLQQPFAAEWLSADVDSATVNFRVYKNCLSVPARKPALQSAKGAAALLLITILALQVISINRRPQRACTEFGFEAGTSAALERHE